MLRKNAHFFYHSVKQALKLLQNHRKNTNLSQFVAQFGPMFARTTMGEMRFPLLVQRKKCPNLDTAPDKFEHFLRFLMSL